MTETLTTEQVEEILALAASVAAIRHAADTITERNFSDQRLYLLRDIERLTPRVSSLATELLALRKRVEELEAKLAAPDWYWPADDTSEDACVFNPSEVLEYDAPGEVVAVVRGGIVETMYCAFLPAADDADSDDDFWVQEPTKEAAVLKIAQERVRRAALPTPKEPS